MKAEGKGCYPFALSLFPFTFPLCFHPASFRLALHLAACSLRKYSFKAAILCGKFKLKQPLAPPPGIPTNTVPFKRG